MGHDSSGNSWQHAREKCQAIGGDLASIPNYAVQRFLLDTFQIEQFESYENIWIGAKKINGDYQWSNGDPFQYTYYQCSTMNQNKLCLHMSGSHDGRWNTAVCDFATETKYYMCQKGSSTQIFWNSIKGAEFSHLETDCIYSRQHALNACVGFGGNLASILTRSILDEVETVFSHQITRTMWIGLNDINNEGTMVWANGDPFYFASWRSGGNPNSDSYDCVGMATNYKYQNFSCGDSSNKGVLCMKGSTGVSEIEMI